jgi:hypothetical protein
LPPNSEHRVVFEHKRQHEVGDGEREVVELRRDARAGEGLVAERRPN